MRKTKILSVIVVLLLLIYCYQMLVVPDCAMQIYKVREQYNDKWYVIYEINNNRLKCIVGDANCYFDKNFKTGEISSSYDNAIWENERKLTIKERIDLARKLKNISKEEMHQYGVDNGISVELLLKNEVSISQLAVLDWNSPEFHIVCADEDVIKLLGELATLIKPEFSIEREAAEKLFKWIDKFNGEIVPTQEKYSEYSYYERTVNYW